MEIPIGVWMYKINPECSVKQVLMPLYFAWLTINQSSRLRCKEISDLFKLEKKKKGKPSSSFGASSAAAPPEGWKTFF